GHCRIGRRHYVKPYPKDRESRVIPVDRSLMLLVQEYVDARGFGPDDFIFVTRRGVPVTKSNVNKLVWHPLLQAARLPPWRFHDLRHSVASWLAADGATLPEVMAIMGHSQLQTAQIYMHMVRSEERDDRIRSILRPRRLRA